MVTLVTRWREALGLQQLLGIFHRCERLVRSEGQLKRAIRPEAIHGLFYVIAAREQDPHFRRALVAAHDIVVQLFIAWHSELEGLKVHNYAALGRLQQWERHLPTACLLSEVAFEPKDLCQHLPYEGVEVQYEDGGSIW